MSPPIHHPELVIGRVLLFAAIALPVLERWLTGIAGSRWLDTRGLTSLRYGILALGGALFVFLAVEALEHEVFSQSRELQVQSTHGHFESRTFWIAWPGDYDFSLAVDDTSVPTADQPRNSFGREWTKRCGQPFPAGVAWSVRRFGRLVAQHTEQTLPWCDDMSRRHELAMGIGTFRATPGPGYSISVAPAGARAPAQPPLHMLLGFHALESWNTAIAAALAVYLLMLTSVICIALGLIMFILDRPHRPAA